MDKKVLILCSKPLLFSSINFSMYDEIYGFEEYLDKITTFTKVKKIPISESIISARDYRFCDHEASIAAEKFFKKFIDLKKLRFLSSYGGENFSYCLINKRLVAEFAAIYRSAQLAKKIVDEKKIFSKITIYPERISYSILEKCLSSDMISKSLNISNFFCLFFKNFNKQISYYFSFFFQDQKHFLIFLKKYFLR